LFQALVAGAARGGSLPDEARTALAWLETLDAPIIAAPPVRAGQSFSNFVPNNDRDKAGFDTDKLSKLRAPKQIKPQLFDNPIPFHYAWAIRPSDDAVAQAVVKIASKLYQLGRGVDMAFANGQLLTADALNGLLASYPGMVHRPSRGGGGQSVSCPARGSLDSLIRRHAANTMRFQEVREPRRPTRTDPSPYKVAGTIFAQAPKAVFRQVHYDCPSVCFLFDIKDVKDQRKSAPQPLARIVDLTTKVRDQAAKKLKHPTWCKDDPKREALIEAVFIGRKAQEADKATRLRIIPLPSIGFEHADRAIRRILVEVPPNCPIPVGDIAWAFSGVPISVGGDGVISSELVQAQDTKMAGHFGVGDGAERCIVWRTVTAAALPVARRRIDPQRKSSEAKKGGERQAEERVAAGSVVQALRHAGIVATAETIKLQREPWDARGARVEAFAEPPRFLKERLWHVEVTFAQPVAGPLTIGDGRYLGLGLMAPVQATTASDGIAMFRVVSPRPIPASLRVELLRAVRRAVMASAREAVGPKEELPRLFSGHEPDGGPARSGRHEHVFYSADVQNGLIDRLLIAAPWRVDRQHQPGMRDRTLFREIVQQIGVVRAGRLGVIYLKPDLDCDLRRDPLLRHAALWTLVTPFCTTRHFKGVGEPVDHIRKDIQLACKRLSLPVPEVEIPGGGHNGQTQLMFSCAVAGPIIIGRGSHFGSGLFRAK
jgi:CRISPR-associated protein Csb2